MCSEWHTLANSRHDAPSCPTLAASSSSSAPPMSCGSSRRQWRRARRRCVFFFQAEDGIRDLTVTGVQTCALPISLASWLVRTRRISPFGALGRTLRAASDPLIRPIEARLVRAGGNPVHAGWWLAVGVAVAGGVFIRLLNLLGDSADSVASGDTGGARPAVGSAVGGLVRGHH